jgi:NADH-quinone oxidoreductase subunit I
VDAIVETRVFEYAFEPGQVHVMNKDMLLAHGDLMESQIAADRSVEAKYR